MSRLLSGLNKPQQQAVTTVQGPVLVLAGAGSGKTKTLTHRIAYLIAEHKVNPWNILAVTFTNKASQEMQRRVKHLLAGQIDHWPAMGTFHSICVRLLRREFPQLGRKSNFVIYDSSDSLNLIKKILKELDLDPKKTNPQAVQAHISRAKNELIDADTYSGTDFFTQQVKKIYPLYSARLAQNQALDFDDLLMQTVQLFRQSEPTLKKYQKLWQHILVDEYQDTNEAQYQLIKLLGGPKPNLCVVGDDYQAIYGFRGANYQNILNFEDDYPKTKIILLEQNYRSTQNILDAAQTVIDQNQKQKKKKLWTDQPAGEKITVAEVVDETAEGEFIIKHILDLPEPADEITYEPEDSTSLIDRIMQSATFKTKRVETRQIASIKQKLKNIKLSDYVILYRTNAQSRVLEEVFIRYGVPYKIIGGIRFYERKEIKDILAYLRVLVNPEDYISLDRIIQAPPRGLGERTWRKIEQLCITRHKTFLDLELAELSELMEKNKASFLAFQKQVSALTDKIAKLNPAQIIDLVLQKTEYKNFIQDGSEEGERRWENVQELKTACLKFNRLTGVAGLTEFLEEVTLVSDQDSVDDQAQAVQMMTVHAAKGLEFNTVFLVGMEEGLFPHSRSLFNPAEMEEERRLCYVAITRARQKLYITFTSQRTIYGQAQVNAPSRFLDDLPKKIISTTNLAACQ